MEEMLAPARSASCTASSAPLSEPGIRFPGGGTAVVINSSATVFPDEAAPPAAAAGAGDTSAGKA